MSTIINAVSDTAANLSRIEGPGPEFSVSPSLKTDNAKTGAPFGNLLTDAIGQIDKLEAQARNAVDGLMVGTGVDVHQAMIASEKASMAFELALAVRNKAVQAYQSVMSMQF